MHGWRFARWPLGDGDRALVYEPPAGGECNWGCARAGTSVPPGGPSNAAESPVRASQRRGGSPGAQLVSSGGLAPPRGSRAGPWFMLWDPLPREGLSAAPFPTGAAGAPPGLARSDVSPGRREGRAWAVAARRADAARWTGAKSCCTQRPPVCVAADDAEEVAFGEIDEHVCAPVVHGPRAGPPPVCASGCYPYLSASLPGERTFWNRPPWTRVTFPLPLAAARACRSELVHECVCRRRILAPQGSSMERASSTAPMRRDGRDGRG